MGKGNFTPEEVQLLKKNPNVRSVADRRITYTKAFKVHFVNEYRMGKSPTQIFREAGFDVKVLGHKRIERASANWKEAYEANKLSVRQGENTIDNKKKTKAEEEHLKLVELGNEVENLKKQIKRLNALMGID